MRWKRDTDQEVVGADTIQADPTATWWVVPGPVGRSLRCPPAVQQMHGQGVAEGDDVAQLVEHSLGEGEVAAYETLAPQTGQIGEVVLGSGASAPA